MSIRQNILIRISAIMAVLCLPSTLAAQAERVFSDTTHIVLADSLYSLTAKELQMHIMTFGKILVTLGKQGSVYIWEGKTMHQECIPIQVVDTTAAGDSFTAAMTLRYLENGGDILDAVRFGNVVGGISVTRPGASESIPTREEAERYLATHPGR